MLSAKQTKVRRGYCRLMTPRGNAGGMARWLVLGRARLVVGEAQEGREGVKTVLIPFYERRYCLLDVFL